MHVLFIHQNFPAQFGHIARYLVRDHGVRCTFVSRRPEGVVEGVRLIHYEPKGGATRHTHYCTRTFENAVAHCHGVYEACRRHPEMQPDLVVGHSGFGSTLFLRELYDCPIINYFEYFYRPRGSDLDYRPEFAPKELDILRSYCRNAMLLLDLQNCNAGYCPTQWQRSLLPAAFADKLEAIFDGVDTEVWHRHEGLPRQVAGRAIDPGTRIVTYVSRGLEAMRGFDIFMKVAKRIYQQMPNVVFVVVGSDRVAYGGDLKYVAEKSFREHVLKSDEYILSKFVFTGLVPPQQLAKLLSLSDLHIYLTVPFVLSWSLLDALACGCTVVASATPPVLELIRHEENGLLADFYDVEGLAGLCLRVLHDPEGHRRLGEAGVARIREKYALARTLPQMLEFYRRVRNSTGRALA
ncbi:MAG: glycosyltransferase [Planctomycetes bacterium]|nr:glycosyltransferase [Planctomycetota bacterium]